MIDDITFIGNSIDIHIHIDEHFMDISQTSQGTDFMNKLVARYLKIIYDPDGFTKFTISFSDGKHTPLQTIRTNDQVRLHLHRLESVISVPYAKVQMLSGTTTEPMDHTYYVGLINNFVKTERLVIAEFEQDGPGKWYLYITTPDKGVCYNPIPSQEIYIIHRAKDTQIVCPDFMVAVDSYTFSS